MPMTEANCSIKTYPHRVNEDDIFYNYAAFMIALLMCHEIMVDKTMIPCFGGYVKPLVCHLENHVIGLWTAKKF